MNHQTQMRAVGIAVGLLTAVPLLGACSPASSAGGSPSPTMPTSLPASETPSSDASETPPSDSAATADFGDCSEASILAALPSGSELKDFECEVASPALWAAARVTSGSTVYFLESTSGPWELHESEEICTGAVTGLPSEILAYCPEG